MASEQAAELMRRRSAIVEHPFGTLKCRAGYQHFLVRGFKKVRGEWSLMALCYNFTRVLNILGFKRFAAYLAEKAPMACKSGLASALRAILPALRRFRANMVLSFAIAPFRDIPASESEFFHSLVGQIKSIFPPVPPSLEGVSRSSRTLEAGCDGRALLQRDVLRGRTMMQAREIVWS
jgi:hypothetical protein